jgi:hypothetical protein
MKYRQGRQDRHNPYNAEVIEFKEVTRHELRMTFSGSSKDTVDLETLEEEYAQGLFTRIPWSEEETLLRSGEGSTIGTNSLRSRELMEGYRIPAGKIKANKQLGNLQNLIEPPSNVPPSKPNRRGVDSASFYTVWTAFRRSRKPAYSSDYKMHGEKGQRLVRMTRPLWQELSRRMRVLCPGQYNELDRAELPGGTKRLAGVWAGFGVNAGSEAVPVRTKAHRDHKSIFFGKSCLYAFGNFTGGHVILWDLRAVLELRPGDAFLFEDHLLTHSNEEVIGERHSLVAFTHQSVLDWHNRRLKRRDKKQEKLKKQRDADQVKHTKGEETDGK